jgi:hypothetical protein
MRESRSASLERLSIYLTAATLLFNLSLLAWYILIGYQDHFHSDSAAKVLLAKEIFDTGRFFPNEWNYVNSDLFIIFGHLFIIPALYFFPAGFFLHAVSGLILSTLILMSLWFLISDLAISSRRKLAIMSVFSAGVSGFFAENLFGQGSYGSVVLICCIVLILTDKLLEKEIRGRLVVATLFVIMFSVAFWSNPNRALISYGLPLLGALIIMIVSNGRSNQKRIIEVLSLAALGCLIGVTMHAITLSEVKNVQGASSANWLHIDDVPRNILLTLKGLYAQLGGLLNANISIFAGAGLFSAIRFGLATAVIGASPFILALAINTEERKLRLISLFATISFLLTFFLQVTTTLPDMSDPIQSSRYLVPGVTFCLLVFLTVRYEWACYPFRALFFSTTLVLLMISGYQNYFKSELSSSGVLAQPGQVSSTRQDLIKFLIANDLKYGYATYWNAGVLSVLSDEKIKVRQVHLEGGSPTPMRHLSSNRWYRPSAWEGKSFLLVHNREKHLLDWGLMGDFGLRPTQELEQNDFRIYVFDKNIANFLPGWDPSFEKAAIFFPNEKSFSQIGMLSRDEYGNPAFLVSDRGEIGALHYGPYINVEPGDYRATFDVIAPYHPNGVIKLDVASSPEQLIFGEVTLTESNSDQIIDFSLTRPSILELRVWSLGNERVHFRSVTLEKQ